LLDRSAIHHVADSSARERRPFARLDELSLGNQAGLAFPQNFHSLTDFGRIDDRHKHLKSHG
jgi:hypothetical protein